MPDWLVTGFLWGAGSLLAAVLTGWILRQSNAAPEASGEGAFVLRYPRVYAWIGGVCVALGLGAVVLGAFWPPEAATDWIWVALAVAMFAVPGAGLVLSALRTVVQVQTDGFTLHSWAHRAPQCVLWREVEQVSFSGTLGMLRFETLDGRRVRLSAGLTGLPDLVGVIERLDARGAARAAERFRAYRKAYGA